MTLDSRLPLLLPLVCILGTGCTMLRGNPVLPDEATWVRQQLVIHSDFELPGKRSLVEQLSAVRDEIRVKLALPDSSEPIHVYLFGKRKRYAAYIAKFYPDLPERRAFFVDGDAGLVIYAHWGERVVEDLRHEVTHGYLHAVIPHLPLWLDEGIAEYLEVPRDSGGLPEQEGVNWAHVELLSELRGRGEWQPDLGRLERLVDMSQLRQEDYAESWLWLHFLLESTPARRLAVQRHLARIRGDDSRLPLIDSLEEPPAQLTESLLAHLEILQQAQAAKN